MRNATPAILREIQSLIDDPLGSVIVKTWEIPGGQLRWIGGAVQSRRNGEASYSLPIPAEEYIITRIGIFSPITA